MTNKSLMTNSPMTLIAGIAIVVIIILLFKKNNQPIGINNLETWHWEDWKGRQRQITVHRDVRSV